ncbi:LptF/LptG family permease [Jannaschia sp. W003]|uniref:LptF/LptG family permease n=1 Tax=Jannaschia sp. W003 TaxID=2867012 RepID=UPI0021A7FCA6|nr:LptF/LptG family permease [Jannaschia sp. W003]UWQ20816.1 LptF/LptG family permease [Jannaschia sp. W003]
MRTFDRYLAGQLLAFFGFFALVLVAVYWVNRAIGLFDRLIAGGSDLATFLAFTALALPAVIYAVVPVAALVAALYGVNRLAGDSELVVAQTAGLGPWSLARPVAAFGLAVGLMLAVLGNLLVPQARTALAERGEALSQDVTARFLKEGEFLHPGEGVTVYVREITPEGELLGLFLQDRRNAALQTSYTAERAYLVSLEAGPRLVMLDGMAQSLEVAARDLVTTTFDDFAYDLGGLTGTETERRRDPRELGTVALLGATAEAQRVTGDPPAELRYEGHARIADPLFAAAVPLLALGFLLQGGYSRLGLWRQIGGAVAAAILLELLNNVAEKRALDTGQWGWTYAPALLAAGLAGLLLVHATLGPRPLRRRLVRERAA